MNSLLQYSYTNLPQCFIVNFNVISSTNEKLGGREYNMKKSFEFIIVIEACGFLEIRYNGQPYTLSNQRDE